MEERLIAVIMIIVVFIIVAWLARMSEEEVTMT